jgi:hypothetical protein
MPKPVRHLRLLALSLLLPAALLAQAAPAAAAPPPNDARASAQPVGALPATLRGTTVDATLDEDEPFSGCGGPGKGSVWYALETPEARAIIVALDAGGEMDATVAVFERQRSQLRPVDCRTTDRRGEATIDVDAAKGADYLIRVAPLANSVSEAFTLRVIAPDPPARPPGQGLPVGGTSGQVDRLANPDDAWAVQMTAGRTYRLNFVSPGRGCPAAQLFAPGAASFDGAAIRELDCDEQTLYTPDRSGRYTVYVGAPRASRVRLPYRLRIGRAGRDDTAPGIEIANDDRVGGSLRGGELDALDLYRFSVARRSDLSVRLETSRNFQVLLLSAGGRRLACGCGPAGSKQVERRIAPGRYFLAVRARDGDGGSYALARLTRTITSSTMLAGAKRSFSLPAGGSINLTLRVSPTVDGRTTMLVERFDPLAGWLFDARFHPRLAGGRATVSFRPPTVGNWRVTGAFDGTRRASPSNGGTAEFTVTEPVTDDG